MIGARWTPTIDDERCWGDGCPEVGLWLAGVEVAWEEMLRESGSPQSGTGIVVLLPKYGIYSKIDCF